MQSICDPRNFQWRELVLDSSESRPGRREILQKTGQPGAFKTAVAGYQEIAPSVDIVDTKLFQGDLPVAQGSTRTHNCKSTGPASVLCVY